MKNFKLAGVAAAAAVALIGAAVAFGPANADVTTNTHYRCWDQTLRVSHGGWVSFRHMAEANCANARRAYPNNEMWVESETYH